MNRASALAVTIFSLVLFLSEPSASLIPEKKFLDPTLPKVVVYRFTASVDRLKDLPNGDLFEWKMGVPIYFTSSSSDSQAKKVLKVEIVIISILNAVLEQLDENGYNDAYIWELWIGNFRENELLVFIAIVGLKDGSKEKYFLMSQYQVLEGLHFIEENISRYFKFSEEGFIQMIFFHFKNGKVEMLVKE